MLTKEKAHEAAEKMLKNRNKSEFVAGGDYENELKYYEWYLMRHGDENTWGAQVDAMTGNEMYQFALENPNEDEEFDRMFGKASPEVEAKAFYMLAVENYFVNYHKYCESGFLEEDQARKIFEEIWRAAREMIEDTMEAYSVDKMFKQIMGLAGVVSDAKYQGRKQAREHAEILESLGWEKSKSEKEPLMTAAQFIDRYNPEKTTDGKIKIKRQMVYDKNEDDAIKFYIDNNREQILAEIDRREKISAEVHEMYK